MRPTWRAALQAGAVVALADLFALRHAWGSWGERAAIAAGVVALLLGAALALSPWLEALAARRPRPWAALGAAALAAALVAPGLAATATLQRHAGRAALPLALLAVLAALAPLPWLCRTRAGRLLAQVAGVAAVALEIALPQRLYPSVRLLLLVFGFAAIGCARHRDAATRPSARALAETLAAALLLVVGGRALVGISANARFVATAQAPAAGFVLDGVALVARAAPPRAAAAATPSQPPADDAAPLGDLFADQAPLAEANFVLVTVDALRADRLRPDLMPHLSALAARGVHFQRAYAVAPSTARSITALLTAHHPAHLQARPPTLAETLRARGWFTAAFYPAGLFFDGGGALDAYAESHFGFAWADTRTLTADPLTDAVLARVRKLKREGEPRAFLWVHYFDTHEPYHPHDLPPNAPAEARYDAEARAVDAALGRLVAGLGELTRPTLLVVGADHGEEFGEHGGAYHGSSLYDEQLRVPLVMTVVGRGLPPRAVAQPVSLVDVVPTVAARLGVPIAAADGVDLALAPSGDVYAAVWTRRMLLRGQWKLIHDTRRDVDELYDLAADPREQRNLVDARPNLVADLRAALDQWLDRDSTETLMARLGDRAGPAAARAAAARQLGERECHAARSALRAALTDPDAAVRAEAAISLGQITDARARPALLALLADERYADRAAIMLGRLRDPAGAPRLAAILGRGAPGNTREAALQREAAHYLGFIGDLSSVDALLTASDDPRVRGAAFVSVGRIAGRSNEGRGDRRVAAILRDAFANEQRSDARADLAWALGLAGDPAAVPLLAAAAAADPPLPRASEALVRLGALDKLEGSNVGGLDLTCRRPTLRAVDAPLEEWLGATRCPITAPSASWRARAPGDAAVVLVRARALGDAARVTITIDGTALPPFDIGPRFVETRLVRPIAAGAGAAPRPVRIELRRDGAPIELDHVLLLRDVTSARL